MWHNTFLKPPKNEQQEEEHEEEKEVQVPNIIMNAHTSAYNIEPHSNEAEVTTDELEGILGIEDDESLRSELQFFQDEEFWDFKPKNSSGYMDLDDKKTSLNLSLNYEEVLEAWSNRGPLWAPSNSYMGQVPVMEEEQRIYSRRRQASVMRYKKKRQSRLFSKKIRYQVRKLNADKRPRIKGRFVKRHGDKMQKGS